MTGIWSCRYLHLYADSGQARDDQITKLLNHGLYVLDFVLSVLRMLIDI